MLIGMKYQARFNHCLGSFPLEYDYSIPIPQYKCKRTVKQLKSYFFCLLVSLIGISMINVSIIIHIFIRPVANFTEMHIPLYTLVTFVELFLLVVCPVIIFLMGTDAVMSINALIVLFRHLQNILDPPKEPKQYNLSLVQKVKGLAREDNGSLDVTGGIMVIFASYSVWCPPMFSVIAMSVNMGPVKTFGMALFGSNIMSDTRVYSVTLIADLLILMIMIGISVRIVQAIIVCCVVTLQFYIKIQNRVQNMLPRARAGNPRDFENLHAE
jgi:hypothetical protein